MCGIVGWLSLNDSGYVDPEKLVRMRDRIAHRGPDDAGLWVDERHRVGLGFRRLSIIDLSETANQPMTNDEGAVLVFNGEIYNHTSLRKELRAKGYRFRTDHSDTETIVHGYQEWYGQIVDHLDGMFAIAIWDQRRQQLFLARDRIGIKPLYFAWTASAFLFASEPKALLAHPDLVPEVEPIAAYHYLSFLTTPAPLTMFRGIYKLPAGFRCFVSPNRTFQVERYWDALPGNGPEAAELKRLSGSALRDFAVRRTRELIEQSIEKRMMSDVPFGALLSGGLDSSLNTALMTKHLGRSVRTFTVGFSDHKELNELEYARQVAQEFKTEHHEVMVDEKAMREYLPTLVYSQDEPIADWVCIPLYFLSKLVRDSGTLVVQVGEGSDEQFCGYRSYMGYLWMYRRCWRPYTRMVPRGVRRLGAKLAECCMRLDDRHDLYWDLIVRAGRDREPFWSGANVFSELRKSLLVDRARIDPLQVPDQLWHSGLLPRSYDHADSFGVIRSFFHRLDRHAPESDILTRMVYSEFKLRLSELLLMRVDKIGMSMSIEPRVPFLECLRRSQSSETPYRFSVTLDLTQNTQGVCES